MRNKGAIKRERKGYCQFINSSIKSDVIHWYKSMRDIFPGSVREGEKEGVCLKFGEII